MTAIARRNHDGIAELRLASSKTNALTTDIVQELAVALDAAMSARAIVLAGGDRFFCNGLDLGWALARDRDELRSFFLALAEVVNKMLTMPAPIVGAMRGHAIGAGKTLLIACDHRVAASGRVLVGSPEVNLGVPNPLFADALLRLIVTDSLANDLLYKGQLVPAGELVASGLVQEVAAAAEVEGRALQVATDLSSRPRAAFAASKVSRTHGLRLLLERSLPSQIETLLDCWFGEEAQALLRLAVKARD